MFGEMQENGEERCRGYSGGCKITARIEVGDVWSKMLENCEAKRALGNVKELT